MEYMKSKYGILCFIFIMLIIVACENPSASKYNPPSSHTISQDGALHKNGYSQPFTNCTSCHGDDLLGGTTGVSCFECHSTKW